MSNRSLPLSPSPPAERDGLDAAPVPVVDSATLLQGGSEILIRHGRREYRLRRTRFDKLILTA